MSVFTFPGFISIQNNAYQIRVSAITSIEINDYDDESEAPTEITVHCGGDEGYTVDDADEIAALIAALEKSAK